MLESASTHTQPLHRLGRSASGFVSVDFPDQTKLKIKN
jgi:hypothetical protein